MEIGETIRELRQNRRMTQQQLAEGICHRSTLNSFEHANSKTSFNDLYQYLRKMNVSLEEFDFILRDSTPDHKKQAAKKVSIAMHKKYNEGFAQELIYDYENSGDFFYYVLYATYYLFRVRAGEDLNSSVIKQLSLKIRDNLEHITTWGRFDLTLFTNCLYLFDKDYIRFEFENSISHMYVYLESSNYSRDILRFLVNGLTLSFERMEMENITLFISELNKLVENHNSTEAYLFYRLFQIMLDHRLGIDNYKEKNELCATLKFLNENGWLRYIEKNY